ncbi:hypothetical protein K437DRAFT_255361 [Tilletiaria anomala UBC 951]|uniref:Uncharacterized protein n=1 Tax=Tilletiaria anomala (strain ATCC 24038 / CBS 436.72 / UBC 951) TaxID=1037660 RepID=A0A066W9K5_TILAU|nr:uncharacterized protein K437DRAFT_255361 [Tilletiaria anomala UBC 951]KDN49233.1 hypothetical protein K437DRAFT_255361 [Tilletiaria anomala UBC 951]
MDTSADAPLVAATSRCASPCCPTRTRSLFWGTQLDSFLTSSDFYMQTGFMMMSKMCIVLYILNARLPATDYQVLADVYGRRDTTSSKENETPAKKSY